LSEIQIKQNRGTENADKQVYADTTFKKTWEESIGDERVGARYFGPAHTGGDSVVYFEEANIAHVGDLVFNEVYPKIDLPGGGSIEGWIDVLELIAKRYDTNTIFIFGHGASNDMVTGKKAELNRMRDYLTALMDYVKKQISAGKNIEEVKKAEFIPPFKGRKGNWEGALAENIQAAYDEMSGKRFD
jgi:cyclase